MMQWVIDLDGVMWRGRVAIPGSVDAVKALLARGDRVIFCTNNSAESGEARAQRLTEHGLPHGCEVVTSADAVVALVEPGERVAVLGGPGLRDAIARHGATALDVMDVGGHRGAAGTSRFDAVVVGLTREIDYARLDVASRLVRDGARLLASNADTTFPGADGLHPGCGSIVAAVEAASGVQASVAGKPHAPMVSLLLDRLGLPGTDQATRGAGQPSAAQPAPDAAGAVADVVVVGDRPDTDGALAAAMGQPFGLVLSGVTGPDDLPSRVPAAWVVADLAELVAVVPSDAHGVPGSP